MQTERQDLCLWYPQAQPKSFSEKKKYDLEIMVCSYNMEEQNDSRDDVQRYVLFISSEHMWILISRPVRSLQSWSKDLSSVKDTTLQYTEPRNLYPKSF